MLKPARAQGCPACRRVCPAVRVSVGPGALLSSGGEGNGEHQVAATEPRAPFSVKRWPPHRPVISVSPLVGLSTSAPLPPVPVDKEPCGPCSPPVFLCLTFSLAAVISSLYLVSVFFGDWSGFPGGEAVRVSPQVQGGQWASLWPAAASPGDCRTSRSLNTSRLASLWS